MRVRRHHSGRTVCRLPVQPTWPALRPAPLRAPCPCPTPPLRGFASSQVMVSRVFTVPQPVPCLASPDVSACANHASRATVTARSQRMPWRAMPRMRPRGQECRGAHVAGASPCTWHASSAGPRGRRMQRRTNPLSAAAAVERVEEGRRGP